MLLLGLQTTVLGSMSTQGVLFVNGKRIYNTLEPVYRHPFVKVNGKTAIPQGVYNVTKEYSGKFKRHMLKLHNVPHFSGILIHSGNTSKDTEGCILVGMSLGLNGLVESKVALQGLESLVFDALAEGKRVKICVARDIRYTCKFPAYFGIVDDEYINWH
jgi:hypothetical protein